MTDADWPYNLPIWQHSLHLKSPNGMMWAEIKDASEVSMGNPTIGTLVLSNGLEVEKCNPSFVWSDDSRFLAVAQYTSNWLGGTGKQKLLILNVLEDSAWRSPKLAHYVQPESFEEGKISVTINPFRKPQVKQFSLESIERGFEFLKMLPNKALQSGRPRVVR
jgi:hypothetical protein